MDSEKAMDVSIIVPTYQEAGNLRALVEGVFAALASTSWKAEMIIVDDDSSDGSEELIAELAGEYPVRILVRKDERDLSSAVIHGFANGAGRVLLCMDADLSHPPASVPEVIRPVMEGRADFCIGSRYVESGSTNEDWGMFRKINSRAASLLAWPLTGARDPMAGFFCLPRERIESAGKLNPIGYKIGLELLIKAGCRNVCEVPIAFENRVEGTSKLGLREQWKYLVHLRRLYNYRWPIAARLVPIGVGILVLVLLARVTGVWPSE